MCVNSFKFSKCAFSFDSFFFFLVSNLALVKPEKTKAVENYLIQMARYGQLSGKVSLDCLEAILPVVIDFIKTYFQKVSFIFWFRSSC